MTASPVLALDIGGGHVTAGVVEGTSVASPVRRSVAGDAAAGVVLGAWAAAALDGCRAATPVAVGIAIPAPFDYERGISRMTHKFPALQGVEVRSALAERWAGTVLDGLPVVFGNDADLWALGETTVAVMADGQDGRGRRLIGLTLGTGLGSGFVADGRIVRAGASVPPDGELWAVPFGAGIAEDRASGRAVVEAWVRRGGAAIDARGDRLDARGVADAARAGDTRAETVFADLGSDLAAVVEPWVRRFEATDLVIGGNVARAFDLFGPTLMERIGTIVRVRGSVLFETATLIGAAALGGEAASGG